MRQIKSFTFGRFQRIQEQIIVPFDGLTFLCGPNSAGKSTVIDAIDQFRHLVDRSAVFEHIWFQEAILSAELAVDLNDYHLNYSNQHVPWGKPDLRDYAKRHEDHGLELLEEIDGRVLRLSFLPGGIEIRVDGTFLLSLGHISYQYTEEEPEESEREYENYLPDGEIGIGWLRDEEEVECAGTALGVSEGFGGFFTRGKIREDMVIKRGEGWVLFRPFDTLLESLYSVDSYSISPEYSYEIAGYFGFIEGVLLLFSHATWPTLAPDSRQVPDSRKTYVERYGKYPDHSIEAAFARYLEKYRPSGAPETRESEEEPLTNQYIKKFLRSFNGQSLVTEEISQQSVFWGAPGQIEADEDQKRSGETRYRFWVHVSDLPLKSPFAFDKVGSGFGYLLPVLLALDCSDASIMQQPELHLHPAAQCELGDVFISALNQGKGCVVETHSEHILLRVLRRVRETTEGYLIPQELKISPEKVLVLYFEPKGSSTQVHRIRLDPYGDFLDPWPRGFFSERESELFPQGLGNE